MKRLDGDTVLRLASRLTIQVEPDGALTVQLPGESIDCPRHGLAILDALTRPRRLAEALDSLARVATGSADWIELTAAVRQLFEAGVLQDAADAPSPTSRASETHWADAWAHISLLSDRVRTRAYLQAIRRVVRPGDVVVDLGTGTGVLAIAAARAGARKVYAIEASPIAETARKLVEANGMSDTVTILQGWSTELSLPEQGDVLVTETFGSEPFGEGAHVFVADGRRRFLKPGGRIVPTSIRLFACPLEAPQRALGRYCFDPRRTRRWSRDYGLDFSALGALPPQARLKLAPALLRGWPPLARPASLGEVDLSLDGLPPAWVGTTTVSRSGRASALLLYFELALTQKDTLSTAPWKALARNWACPVWLDADAPTLKRGDEIQLSYKTGLPAGELRLSRERGERTERGHVLAGPARRD